MLFDTKKNLHFTFSRWATSQGVIFQRRINIGNLQASGELFTKWGESRDWKRADCDTSIESGIGELIILPAEKTIPISKSVVLTYYLRKKTLASFQSSWISRPIRLQKESVLRRHSTKVKAKPTFTRPKHPNYKKDLCESPSENGNAEPDLSATGFNKKHSVQWGELGLISWSVNGYKRAAPNAGSRD